MYDIHYLEKERLACIRLHGPVKGAEVQRAVTEAALQAGGAVTKVLLDYREVSAMDLTETDGAMASINSERLRATGVDVAGLQMSWVTDPRNAAVNEILYERMKRTAPHRVREGFGRLGSAERSFDEALVALDFPGDFSLPY